MKTIKKLLSLLLRTTAVVLYFATVIYCFSDAGFGGTALMETTGNNMYYHTDFGSFYGIVLGVFWLLTSTLVITVTCCLLVFVIGSAVPCYLMDGIKYLIEGEDK
jgi:hypothetical protein